MHIYALWERPVLCNTAQPNQLKCVFNLCVVFLHGLAECVCVFVSMLKRGLLCRDMFTFLKLWKTDGVALSLFLLLYSSFFFSFFSLFVVVLMGRTESHSQAAHSSCHDGNWQGVHSEKRRERRIEAKIYRDWVGCDCLTLICRQSKRRIYVYVWVCVCVMRKWMHGHANTYMAAGNYRWLGKGKIQSCCFKCEFSHSRCSKPKKKCWRIWPLFSV